MYDPNRTKGKYPTLAHSRHPVQPGSELGKGRLRSSEKATVQRHKFTKKLILNHRTIECFPSLQFLSDYSKLIYKVPFIHHFWLVGNNYKPYQKASEQDSEMTTMLELSDQEFETIMVNLLTPIDRNVSTQE